MYLDAITNLKNIGLVVYLLPKQKSKGVEFTTQKNNKQKSSIFNDTSSSSG